MKGYKKVLVILLGMMFLLMGLNTGLNLWIKYQLPRIVNRENNSAYAISFKDMQVSIWNNNIFLRHVWVVSKKAKPANTFKARIYAKIKSVEIRRFKVWDLLFSDKIKAQSIHVDQPQVMVYRSKTKDNDSKNIRNALAPMEQIISVTNIFLHQGDLKIMEPSQAKLVFSMENIHLQLDGWVISDEILKEQIPFRFRDYSFKCEQIYYRPSMFYHLKAKEITSSKNSFQLLKLEMIPEFSRSEFVKRIPQERDLYTLRCDSLTIQKMDWGFRGEEFFFHSPKIFLDQISANIYRSKLPEDDLKKKPLYNQLLRNLKFDLKVDTLAVRHSMIEYEEEKSTEMGPGKLSFSRFNLTACNIQSGFKKQKLEDVKIKIDCRFMSASSLKVDWKFNVMDQSDGFNIRGKLTNFEAQAMAPFTKPYLNVTTQGVMDEVNFNFTGNDKRNRGEFAVKYDDLKFTIYQKDQPKKKNKLLTFVAKIFVKKDTQERLKTAKVHLERIPEKSFYNLLWRSVAEGLKKILV